MTVHEALREKWLWVEKNTVKAIAFWLCECFVATRKYDAWQVISQATRTDLLKYHVDPRRVVLIFLGVDPAKASGSHSGDQQSRDQPFDHQT